MKRLLPLCVSYLAALLVAAALSTSASAEPACQINSWLATTYHRSLAFSQSLDQGTSTSAAVDLKSHLALFSITNIRLSMRENGLDPSEKLVNEFIRVQEVLLQVYALSGPQQTILTAAKLGHAQLMRQMQKIISAMQCREDSDWRPDQVAESDSAFGPPIPLTYLGLIILGALVAVALLTRQIMRYNARKQRRGKRHVCNIHARFNHSGKSWQAKMVDISREGAKLRTEMPQQGTVKCSVTLLDQDTPAQIRWSNKTFTGVTFRHALSADMLKTLLESPQSPAELRTATSKNGTRLGAALHE